jgi:tRNA (guanine37-N1)-methyltransferase
MKKFEILTIFPSLFTSPFNESIIKRARDKNIIEINVYNLRDYTYDKHRVVDDYPFGGGAGMVMKPEPIINAIESLRVKGSRIILTTPQGKLFTQEYAKRLLNFDHIIIICGRYEGVDERTRNFVDEEISIGDYILTGGELAAMVIIDVITRMIPGVLGNMESISNESFFEYLLEGPQYTRPREYRGIKVPDILLSGDHNKIKEWRRKESLKRTLERRPELLKKSRLYPEDMEYLLELRRKKDEYNR